MIQRQEPRREPALRVPSRPRAPAGSLTPWFLVIVLCAREGAVFCRRSTRERWRVLALDPAHVHLRADAARRQAPRLHSVCKNAGTIRAGRGRTPSILRDNRLGTVLALRPSRTRVSSWSRRRQGLGAARRPRVHTTAASGLDRACAQLADLPLRDGRPDCVVHRTWLSLTPHSRGRILRISRRCRYHTAPPSASHSVHAERVSDPRPQGTIQRHKTKFRTVFVHSRCTNDRSRTSERVRDQLSAALVLRTGIH